MKGLPGSGILEAAIGISFVYLLMAVFCSTVNEWIAALLNSRANTLLATIRELLNNQSGAGGREFLDAFYSHPIVTSMMDDGRHPCYFPSRSFVTAVIDLATPAVQGSVLFADLEAGLASLPDGDVRTSLLALIQNASGNLSRVESNIEDWFNDSMARASRSYKKRTAWWIAGIATLLTVALNADTIAMFRGSRLPGWDGVALASPFSVWIARVTGWCLTIAAVSLGAPFWFNVLNRFVNPRSMRSLQTSHESRTV